jgi:indolepyruvate ferredoxin oxidoreductase
MQVLEPTASGRRPPALVLLGLPAQHQHRVPEGSRAMAGIGCHFMATWMDRSTAPSRRWAARACPGWASALHHEQHVFANLGDGTYFHSGLLAIRQSIAAGVNITYKILYNDAVAMTGGQPVGERPEGHSVLQIAQSMRAEGRRRSPSSPTSPRSTRACKACPRASRPAPRPLDAVQREFREIKGTTVIIYDQTCATEKRRRRKRGTLADPAGAWSSTSWSARAAATAACSPTACGGAAGDRVRPQARINQSSCNKDIPASRASAPASSPSKAAAQEEGQGPGPSPFELARCPCPSRCAAGESRPGASWWPASAAPA